MNQPLLDHGPALTVDNLNAIRELSEDGMTAQEIAGRLSIGTRSVHKGRAIMGIDRRIHCGNLGQPVDDVAVLRATWGDGVELNADERREAITTMSARGLSHAEIARTLRVCTRTVERHVAKVRAA